MKRFAFFKRQVIERNGDPYMIRFRLIQTPWFAVYLHHILRSDVDIDLHDHPWNFWSIMLSGGYWEQVRDDQGENRERWIAPWSIVRHRAEDYHRLVLYRPAWTLVLCGRRRPSRETVSSVTVFDLGQGA